MASKKERDRQEKRKAGKVTYDLPPELKATIADLAAEYRVPQSQIAALLLICGLDALETIDLAKYMSPSRSPLHDYNIDLVSFMEDWKNR